MPRRRREVAQEESTNELEPLPVNEPQIDVRMRGTADQVKRQLGVGAEAKPEEEKKPSTPEDSIEKFCELLRNPKYIVKVKRLRPKQWQGQKANVEVWTSELPLQWEEIKSEVAENYQGGTYKTSVINPETGGVLDARNFEVEGDPKLESVEMSPEEKAMFGPEEKDATTITLEGLERTAQVTAKQIEVERLQRALKESREEANGKKNSPERDSRIDDLERRLVEAKHQAELEARDRKHAEELKELRDLITQNQKPPQQQASEITLLVQQMQKSQESSDKRFEALQKQMQDDKLNALLEEVKSIKNKPQQQGSLLEMADTMLKMKKLFGWGDDDEDDDKDDDRPWYERALDKLSDKLTEPVIDKLLSKFDGIEKGGKEVSKEEFMKNVDVELQEHARRIADEEIKKLTGRRQAEAPPLRTENPSKESPRAIAPPPGTGRQEPHVSALPPPAPQSAPPASPATLEKQAVSTGEAPPSSAPAAAETPVQQMSTAQKICYMVVGAIVALEQELDIRPKNWEWTFSWWDGLPEEVLEKACTAPGPLEMFDALKVEGINVSDMDKLKSKIQENSKMLFWVKLGHDELRRWHEKAQKDPNFNPEDEEEEDPEEKEEERG